MKNHDGDRREFRQLSRTWYGKSSLEYKSEIKDEISFGLYSPDGGTSGEMTIKWIWLSNKYVPQLNIYSDGWSTLSQFHDLIDVLGQHDSEDPTPEEFCQYLLQCGFDDKTEETNPHPEYEL